jgi:hypothetical protein
MEANLNQSTFVFGCGNMT